MYMIVPLAIYLLERLVRLVLPHVRNTELVDVKLMGGNEKVWMGKHAPTSGVGSGIELGSAYPSRLHPTAVSTAVAVCQVRLTCVSNEHSLLRTIDTRR